MQKVYVLGAKRTPIGSFLGSLSKLHPKVYAAEVIKTLIQDTKISIHDINEVIVGNVLPAGLGHGLARQISITAGIPDHVPAYGVNMVCGSGMKSVMTAFTQIASGFSDLIIAGGAESMSKAPYLIDASTRHGVKTGGPSIRDHLLVDGLMDAFNDIHMGITAENIAEKYQISRDAQDDFAWASQVKAIEAVDKGRFEDEVVPISIPSKKGTLLFNKDEYPNRTSSREKLATLRPAFKEEGSVTAGNSSGINDGASFLVLASEEYVLKHHLTPVMEIIGIGQGALDPNYMGLGPTPAIKKALAFAKYDLKDIDLMELNEAFAAQALGVVHELSETFNIPQETLLEKTNVNGGAIALGHPLGASGNRIIVTLIHEMIKQNKSLGLASLCIGGGMGTAVIVRRPG
jgi:acetyl-CoA C-acetyltransferase